MDLTAYNAILPVTGAISVFCGAWYSVLKILRELHKAKKIETDKIIEECKELDLILKSKLESKINLLEAQLHNLEFNVSKDLSNIKDTHALELKNLGDKIEALRNDLQNQHAGVLQLLTRLVDR
jgi:hypothetical protein